MGLRTCAFLLAAAASAAGQDLPLIRAAGTSLETFEVELRLDAVDHATAEGLAKSFARFEEEHHGVRRRFAELVRDAHLDLLRRHYAKDLVDRQASAYDRMEQKGYRSEVTSVANEGNKALARLRRTYVVAGKEREETTEIDLVLDGARWRIAAIRDRARDGRLVERPLGTPPALKRAAVPAPGAPDLSSAKAAVASLREAALRFGAMRHNAALSLTDRFFDITAVFFGDDAARKARESRPRLDTPPAFVIEIGEPAPRLADLMRVVATLHEEGKRAVIAQATFDLREEEGGWKVAGEYRNADGQEQAASDGFALFFLRM